MENLRKAKLPDGSVILFHMFFADADGNPSAIVETLGGSVKTVPSTWVEFLQPAKQSVQADGLQPGQRFNPYDLNEVAQIDKLIKRRR